jgi:selenocysteine-specific elongation factor
METVAGVVLYERKEFEPSLAKNARVGHGTREARSESTGHGGLSPGQETFARLKLAEPALLAPGDRFIIRQFSPVVTIGGGVVLDAATISRKSQAPDFLEILNGGNPEKILTARLARRAERGISLLQLVSETGWTKEMIEEQFAGALKTREVVRAGALFLHTPVVEKLRTRMESALAEFHKKNPLVGGVGREELRAKVQATAEVFEAIAGLMIREKKIEVTGDLVRLPGHGVVMKDEEAESKKQIEDAFATAGLQVPALQEVLAGLKVDRGRAQKIVTLLLRERTLVKVSDDLIFHRSALEGLHRKIAAYKAKAARIDVAAFKELTGITRKYAIPLLEYLDRERVTRRVGDVREIL